MCKITPEIAAEANVADEIWFSGTEPNSLLYRDTSASSCTCRSILCSIVAVTTTLAFMTRELLLSLLGYHFLLRKLMLRLHFTISMLFGLTTAILRFVTNGLITTILLIMSLTSPLFFLELSP